MSGRTKLLLSASGVAVISAALGVLSRDIFTTGLPPDAIPPKKVPEGLYDTFKPGDLIYNAIDFIGTNRAHYAVYVGKIDGKHSMFDVSPGKLNGGAAAVARIRTLEEGQDEKGTSFAKASRIDKSKQGPTAAQLQQIIKQLENKKFEWNGFENNCESFARAIVNDVPVSLQGKKATEATNQLTKVLLRLGAPKDFYKSAYSLRYVSQVVRAAQRRRTDAPEGGQGKPCGESFIPKNNKCSKKTGSSTNSNLQTVATVALAAGVLAGGTYLFKKKYFSKEEWDNHPANKLNNPKLTEAEAQRIVDEAIAGGQKWDAQEKINARRSAAECGGGLGKIQAPAKFDAAIPTPRCQAGEGAFGTYFVHPSEQYGIKLFRNGNEDDVASEFRRLDKADYAGVNVPSPLRMQAIRDADGEVRAQTLVLTHMKGYKTIDSEHGNAYGTAADAPLIVQRNIARQFRLLHTAGLAHGDIHSGNLMVNPRSRKVALIDFGYATELHDPRQSPHYRNGVQNLLSDMNRLPEFLGFSSRGTDFISRYKGVLSNVEKQAKELSSYGGRDNEERFQIAVKRYHDALETELLWDDRMPRSRFVSGADQPRIPGLTRRILTANANTRERDIMARDFVQKSTLFQQQAAALGVKRPRLFLALKPERDVRARQKPFGTPIPAVSTYKFGGPRRSTRSLQTPEYEWED